MSCGLDSSGVSPLCVGALSAVLLPPRAALVQLGRCRLAVWLKFWLLVDGMRDLIQ